MARQALQALASRLAARVPPPCHGRIRSGYPLVEAKS